MQPSAGDNVEHAIATAWAQELGLAEIGPHDDFFMLGGHSLQATRITSRLRAVLGVDLPGECMFDAPTVSALADYIREIREPGTPSLAGGTMKQYPASFAQQRQWFLHQLAPRSAAYNVAEAVTLTGALDLTALQRAVTEIVRRHEALRTRFAETTAGLTAFVTEAGSVPLHVTDLTGEDPAGTVAEEAARPFDLATGPLLRTRLLRLAERRHVFVVTIHHIATDGWSMRVWWEELAELYKAFSTSRPVQLAEPPVQYSGYASWQREWLAGEQLAEQISYWRHALAGAPATLELPADHQRPATQSFRGARRTFALTAPIVQRLRALGSQRGATLFMSLLAVFTTLLSRLTGQRDILVGTPIAGRTRAELEGLIGFFVNTLVLRTDLSGSPSFRTVLDRVRDTALGAYAHQDLPFERLVAELAPDRSAAVNPLFQVMLVLHNAGAPEVRMPGLDVEVVGIGNHTAKFDLKLLITERGDDLDCTLEYSTDLFDAKTAERFEAQFVQLTDQVTAAPDRSVHACSLVTPAARETLPDPTAPLSRPRYDTVAAMFTAWADRSPELTACRHRDRSWTYGELHEAADRIAQALLAAGVQPKDAVAVTGPRSFGLMAAMLGTLLTGGVLLPVDPALPARRRTLLCQEGGARWLVRAGTDTGWTAPDLPTLAVSTDTGAIDARNSRQNNTRPPTHTSTDLAVSTDPGAVGKPGSCHLPEVNGDAPAYILFTSGTSGTPKAVLGSHQGISHFVCWELETFGIGPGDRVAQLTSLSFDPILRDVFVPLAGGATVCLPDEDIPRPPSVLSWLEREQVSILHVVPSLAQWWLGEIPPGVSLGALRHVLFAGEPLLKTLVDRWRAAFPSAGIANLYGPTETTQSKCFAIIGEPAAGVQPIGRPLPHTQLLVLSQTGQLCGPGELGEIVIRTPFRALGYVGPAADSTTRFAVNPFTGDPGDLVYHSGDLGRYRDDGTLAIAGRVDDQIKIRGVRIEPDEVTAVLSRQRGVERCFVLASKDADRTVLTGYVVPSRTAPPTADDLIDALRSELPMVMVPRTYVFLPEIPLTRNGKIDRARLPRPSAEPRRAAPEQPRTPTEEIMARLWGAVLGRDLVGVHDDFFALGGQSLLAAQLVARVRDAFDVELPITAVFEARTVARLSARLGTRGNGAPPLRRAHARVDG